MEMRLGKNLTMIRHLKSIGIHNKILIVTDYGAMRGWELELRGESEQVHTLIGIKEQRLNLLRQANSGYVISNYESAKRLSLHKAHDWNVVILDETIKIANPKNETTKYFLSAYKNVRLKFVLNGKPMPESLMQLCCQFLFVHGTYMGCKNFWEYRARNYVQDYTGFDWIPKGNHVQDVHKYVHKHAFIMTRKDANIGSDKHVIERIVKMSNEQKLAVKELAKYYEYDGVEYKNDLGLQIGMSYMASGLSPSEASNHKPLSFTKVEELLHVIEEVDDNKILIWCRFRAEQNFISEYLKNNYVKHVSINGDLSKPERDNIKQQFENDPEIKCCILTIKSSAKGQDWSISNTSIYFSREWSNDLQSQSEDRLVHVQKSNPILIIHLITEKSVDEDVMLALRNKEFDSKLVMGNFLSKYKSKGLHV